MNSDTNAQLAAVVHNHFELHLLNDEVQKTRLLTTLKSQINAVIKNENKKIG